MRAGGSYSVVFGKKLQSFAAQTLDVEMPMVYAPSKKVCLYQRTSVPKKIRIKSNTERQKVMKSGQKGGMG